MKKIIRHANGRTQVHTINDEKTKTQQHHKDAHDINNIMKKYQKIGVDYNRLPPNSKGQYGDFSKHKSYQESVQALIDANNSFMSLPSTVRKRFSNDPQELFDFLNDTNNRDEAIKLGLLDKPLKIEGELPVQPPSVAPKTPTT